MTKNNIASFHWTSPELLAAKPFGRNTDIWLVTLFWPVKSDISAVTRLAIVVKYSCRIG